MRESRYASLVHEPVTGEGFLQAFRQRSYQAIKEKAVQSLECDQKFYEWMQKTISPLLGSTPSLTATQEHLQKTLLGSLEELGKAYKIQIVHMNFQFSIDDLLLYGMLEKDYIRGLLDGTFVHYCAEYAFYQLGEPLEKTISCLGTSFSSPLFSLSLPEALKILEQMDYTATQEPDRGDLIVYVDEKENKITHLGVFESSSQVRSKWGALPVFSHPIDQVSNAFGSAYLCLRKSLPARVHNLFHTIEKALPGFLHSTCYSPLSTLGTVEAIKHELFSLFCANRESWQKTRLVAQKLRDFTPESFLHKEEAVMHIRNLTLSHLA
ncbi:MAG: hypothetical protein FJZ58_04305 [Chlamydiae bacterium]|nr:hypothetical protein [Chlamydiota bacterium]